MFNMLVRTGYKPFSNRIMEIESPRPNLLIWTDFSDRTSWFNKMMRQNLYRISTVYWFKRWTLENAAPLNKTLSQKL